MTTTKANKLTQPTVMLAGALKRIDRKGGRALAHCADTILAELQWRVEQAKREVGL